MTDLEFLQLLIIFTLIFWIFLEVKKKSNKKKFAAGPSFVIPWNLNIEKNKVYIFMKDPLTFDLQYVYTEFVTNDNLILKFNTGTSYATNWKDTNVQVETQIGISDDDRLVLKENVDNVVKLQNLIFEDLREIIKQSKGISKLKDIDIESVSSKKIDISKTTKYQRLATATMTPTTLFKTGNFEPVYDNSGNIIDSPIKNWQISPEIKKNPASQTSQSGVYYYYNTSNKTYNPYVSVPSSNLVLTNQYDSSNVFFGTKTIPLIYSYNPGNLSTNAAYLTYMNTNDDTSVTRPFIQQKVTLETGVTYKLSYNFLADRPFNVTLIDSQGNSQVLASYNGYYEGMLRWRYNEVVFNSTFNGEVTIKFSSIQSLLANDIRNFLSSSSTEDYRIGGIYYNQFLLLGGGGWMDPNEISTLVLDNVNLIKNDANYTSYWPYNYNSVYINDDEVYIMLNGKYKKFDLTNLDDKNDFSIKNGRRLSISEFLNKYYID